MKRDPALIDRVWSVSHVCGASRSGCVNREMITKWGGNSGISLTWAVVMGLAVELLRLVLGNLQEIQGELQSL